MTALAFYPPVNGSELELALELGCSFNPHGLQLFAVTTPRGVEFDEQHVPGIGDLLLEVGVGQHDDISARVK